MRYSTEEIENIIYQYLPEEEGYAKPVIEAMNYAFKAGGKRLRPMLMKLCYDMYAVDTEKEQTAIGMFMAAIEMIHTYSLIHDDLPALDNDVLRRGKPTVHVKFGEDIAILAGDGLLNLAYETAARAFLIMPGNRAVEKAYMVLASKPGIRGMVGGQTLDVVMSGKKIDEEQLQYIYLNKTSALIACSMMVGALLGGASDEEISLIEEAANAIGMAFQVQDDILDIVGDEKKLGKPINSDEKNQKYTFATIHGIEHARQYVHDMSEKANTIIDNLAVYDKTAQKDLAELVVKLIDRDR